MVDIADGLFVDVYIHVSIFKQTILVYVDYFASFGDEPVSIGDNERVGNPVGSPIDV